MQKIAADHLVATTAAEQVMTRPRAKRKPQNFADTALAMDAAKAAKRATSLKKATPPKKTVAASKKTLVAKKAAPSKKAAAVKKTVPAKKTATTKHAAPSKKAPSAAKKEATKKTANGGKKSSGSAADKTAAAAKRKATEAEQAGKKSKPNGEAVVTESVEPKGIDLYEKHRREFDRFMARLEKIDRYGWFWDTPDELEGTCDDADQPLGAPPQSSQPEDHDNQIEAESKSEETVTDSVSKPQHDGMETAPISGDGVGAATEPMPEKTNSTESAIPTAEQTMTDTVAKDESNGVKTELKAHTDAPGELKSVAQHDPPLETTEAISQQKKGSASVTKKTVLVPEPVPFNWHMIRERKALGRYELNREVAEEEEYRSLMRPYVRSTGRKFPPRKKKQQGKGETTKDQKIFGPRVLYAKGVHWHAFEKDVLAMIKAAYARTDDPSLGGPGCLDIAAKKTREALEQAVERAGRRQEKEMKYYDDRHRFDRVLSSKSNTEAAMQSWRSQPFPERRYERLTSAVVSDGLSELDERTASYELKTNLADSFIGMSYRYDDTGQSEAWMQSVVDEAGTKGRGKSMDQAKQAAMALAADEGVVRAQVVATMQSLLIGVQDRVMTTMSVLQQPELLSANWVESENPAMKIDPVDEMPTSRDDRQKAEIVEQPVWGIDCYTRRNLLICLESEFDSLTSVTFVEKWLLPAVNACPPDIGHDISNAARILEGLPFQMPVEEDRDEKMAEEEAEPSSVQQWTHTLLGNAIVEKIKSSSPPWLKAAANLIRRARASLGANFFRVHPKGHGSVLLSQKVKANRLVTFYRGEIYPAWRWGEKMDAIEITQDRKGLKPALPDFYNMALERPQTDPRGYGLLFVDASRKGGHGSSLSHSCQPTCEVRVAAKNGELCLAMTTLRELEMGEELTFDYNAATDSLVEYQSALCLCGYEKCRGSFLHYATAECYQKVMNRNSPIASRFANLIKGCMKKVMSEEDEKVLTNHGFRTAAFGAISVNRRDADTVNLKLSDSMDIVPVWLRTYAADTLRYIEYERRALPISLICDKLTPDKLSGKIKDSSEKSTKQPKKPEPPKEPLKPEPSFFFFSRNQSEHIISVLKDQGFSETGLALQAAKQKIAGKVWGELSSEKKEFWKNESMKDLERRKIEWKAQRARARKAAARQKASESGKTSITSSAGSSQVDFQTADAEGVSAMEHRIQHLTQALSRVGRVLDRHREQQLDGEADIAGLALRDVVHSPLKVLSDHEVINRIWTDEDSIVRSLSTFVKKSECVSNELRRDCLDIIKKHEFLESFGKSPKDQDAKPGGSAARGTMKRALIELRRAIMENLRSMTKQFRLYKAKVTNEKSSTENNEKRPPSLSSSPSRSRDDDDSGIASRSAGDEKDEVRSEVCAVLNDVIHKLEQQQNGVRTTVESMASAEEILSANAWIDHFGERICLEAAADLLLLYANTSNYFVVNPYTKLESTPVEVYARELGNVVPKAAIDAELLPPDLSADVDGESTELKPKASNSKSPDVCSPDDVVAKVAVRYGGEYVVSQLLQWFNGGIGQKPGLPDLSGCVILPHVSGCWSSAALPKKKIITDKKTVYDARLRRRLVEWLQDPFRRGDPFPDEVKQAFYGTDVDHLPAERALFGSPILDFLVTGDEASIFSSLEELDTDNKIANEGTGPGTLATVDKGRPAQAVSRWVQCENTECLKWRKIPWQVDIDLLPEKFFCYENKWDPDRTSCAIPEDDWDQDDKVVGADGKVEGSPIRKKGPADPSKESSFRVGAKFDVLRMVRGKGKYAVATVTHIDFSGMVKRIKVHFQKTMSGADEWVEFGSDRIATLYSKTGDPSTKKKDSKKPKDAPVDKTKSSTLLEGEVKAEKKAKRKDDGKANREKKKSKEPATSTGKNAHAKKKQAKEARGEVEGETSSKKRPSEEGRIANVKKQKSLIKNEAGLKALLEACSVETASRDQASETTTAITHTDKAERPCPPDATVIDPRNGKGHDECASIEPSRTPAPVLSSPTVSAVREPAPMQSVPIVSAIHEPAPIPRAATVSDDYFTPDVPNSTARRVTTEKTFQTSVESARTPTFAQFSPAIQTIPVDANRLHSEVGGMHWSAPSNSGSVPLQHRPPDMSSFARVPSVPSPPDFSLANRSGTMGQSSEMGNTWSPSIDQFSRQGGRFGDFQPSVPPVPHPPPQVNDMAMMASVLLGRAPQPGQPNFHGFAEPSFQEIQAMLQQQQQPGGPMDAALLRRLQQLLGNSNPGFYRE
jgi:hypothetical protein